MRGLSTTCLALGLLAPLAAAGGPLPPPTFHYGPQFNGRIDDYGFGLDLDGIKVKTGSLRRGCPQRRRGVVFKASEDMAGGFLQVFPNPNDKRRPVAIDVLIDPARLGPGARAAVELDSPFVPIGGSFDQWVILTVDRLPDGSLVVRTFANDGVQVTQVGSDLPLPGDTPGVDVSIDYANDAVDVAAGPCTGAPSPIATGAPLVFGGSSGIGFGIQGDKGAGAGFAFEISGDLFTAQKQDVLEDLQALIDLENQAAADLGAGNGAAAKTKLEQAQQLLNTQGPQIPGTDPPQFEPPLVTKVQGLPESDARAEALKRLEKASGKDASAVEKIDQGKNDKAAKRVTGAVTEKNRAKAILETGVVAEGKGKL